MSAPVFLQPRSFGLVNWLGLSTMIRKETNRFLKVHAQTITAPVVTTLLFYAIFAITMGHERLIEGVPYLQFLPPGLIMMSMAQNAFANSASSLVIAKVQGNIVDVLMPPLSSVELMLGYTIGALIRAVLIGIVSVIAMAFMVDIHVHDLFYILYHGIMGALMLALIGVIGGIWSDKFDHLAAVQNFIVMPATFLSGTFYMANQLPPMVQWLCHFNPFFYMIDGFRYGFVGVSDGTLGLGIAVMALTNIALLSSTYHLLRSGWKLKS
jgi:ABC-2 type transport system permease protein